MKKVLRTAAVVIVLLIVSIPVKLFFIGEPVDGASVHCSVSEEADGNLRLHVSTAASAIAFRGWKYHQEGNTLYISARKVLVSRLFPSGVYSTTIATDSVTQVYFGGKLLWSTK